MNADWGSSRQSMKIWDIAAEAAMVKAQEEKAWKELRRRLLDVFVDLHFDFKAI